MITFTLFTGTYNSEKTIHRVFESITSQTVRDFEWIVIDNCSADGTVKLIEEFRDKHPHIAMSIFKHAINMGVAVSRSEAVKVANGKYFISWDSDDQQDPLQLETYLTLWQKYGDDQIANIFTKIKDQHGNFLGKKFPSEVYISDYITMHNDFLVGNKEAGNVIEHHVCASTDKYLEVLDYYEKHSELLKGRYPDNAEVWGMMGYLGYRTIYSNTIVRKYYIDEENRLSMSSARRKDVAQKTFQYKLLWVNLFDTKLSYREYRWKLRNIFAAVMYGLLSNIVLWKILRRVKHPVKKFIALLFYLPAKFLAVKFSRQ